MEFARATHGVPDLVIDSFEKTTHQSVRCPFRLAFLIGKLFEDKPDHFCRDGTYWFTVIN